MTADRPLSARPVRRDGRRGCDGRGRRVTGLVALVAVLATACASGPGPAATTGRQAPAPRGVTQVQASPEDVAISALDDPAADGLPKPLIDPAEILSGGPPPDGIPSIDDPRFLHTDEVDFLDDREPVLALTIGEDARAYPVQVVIWHEIVNDTVGGVPVAVTYCPLCNSAVAYDRRSGGRVLEFGTSGSLYRSALVMYDRQTESLWSHFTGQAVAGTLTGDTLRTFPVSTVAWGDWRAANPDGLVLSRETGFRRDYASNPYPGYDEPSSRPFLFQGEIDPRLENKSRVVGLAGEDDAVAVVHEALTERRVIAVQLSGRPLVVWLKPGTASALDAGSVAGGRDVGATGVFVPTAGGRRLRFTPAGDHFVDEQTNTTWDVLGRAVAGPLKGERLEPVEHVDTFWFAWAAFEPETRIVE